MKLKKALKKVEKFNSAMGVQITNTPHLSILSDLRYDLMKEEVDEYLTATKENDIVGVLDALVDQLYILLGTVCVHGLQDVFEEAFKLVHENNMTKLDEDGNPIINGKNGVVDLDKPMGKILKPKNYTPVNLNHLIDRYDNHSIK